MYKRIPWRSIAVITILLVTISAITIYLIRNPKLFDLLKNTSPVAIALIFSLYLLFILSLAFINDATLKLCKQPIKASESLLVTMYSSVVNFFGPLQSGPAFRALYFKKLHNVDLKKFTLATFAYYIFYALFSGIFLLASSITWWLLPLFAAGFSLVLIYTKARPYALNKIKILNLKFIGYLGIATLVQILIQAVIYYVELNSIMSGVGIGQVLAYTGAANFALFVSITPGAIGFRESFLLFSEKLHHISSGNIVVATTLDRAVYVTVLIFLAIIIFATHAQKKFTNLEK